MRRFVSLWSVVILAAVTAVPLSLAQSGSSQDTQQTQPGQTPVNPIQEATQPGSIAQQQQQQQQQQQSEAAKGKPSTFDISGAATGQQDQELGEARLMTRYSDINSGSPQGLARSFHNQGENDLAEFNYFLDHSLFSTAHRFQMLSMFRGTDDTSIDPERNSVQKAFLRFYGPRDELIFGDALVNYSRLTFNQNIKGASASKRFGQRWKLSATGGVFIDRWGSLFKDQPFNEPATMISPITGQPTNFVIDPTTGQRVPVVSGCQPAFTPAPFNFVQSGDPQCGRPFTAVVSGARLEYAFNRDSAIGFNFSSSRDLAYTRADLPVGTTQPFPSPQPADNKVGSIDFKYAHRNLRMDGEWAYSATNFDTRATMCVAPCDSRLPTAGLGTQGDWGARFEAQYRWHRFNFRTSYVRYEPTFVAINARQISDLQDFLFRVSYDMLPWLTVDGTMRRNNNNLKLQLPYETTIWGPEGRLIFHDLSFYRRMSVEVGYRHRFIDGSANSVSPSLLQTTSTGTTLTAPCVYHGTGVRCIDRFLRQPYVEVTLPVSTTFLTVGYERRQSVDLLQGGQSNNTDRIYGGLRGIYDLGGWHVSPTLRYEMERQTHRGDLDTFLGLPANQTQYLNPYQFLFLDHDTNRLATVQLYIEAPRWFILEGGFRATSATITTPATLAIPCASIVPYPCAPGQTTISQIVNGANGYSRPSYRLALTYKIANDENKVLIFSFERNSNFYFAPPSASDPEGYYPNVARTNPPLFNPLNFDERIAGVTFVYKFGKRAR